MSEKITVFDIEILNQDPTSICSIGIVELEDLEIKSTYYSLIKPRSLEFDVYRYKVHKIKSQSLIHERSFKEVWREISHYFDDHIIVSHDVQVDMMYMREALKANQITYPSIFMSCTNVMSHLVHQNLVKYNLNELSEMIHYEFKAHHALEDAKAAAHLLIYLLNEANCGTLQEFHEKYHIEFGEMKKNYYRNIISPENAVQISQNYEKKNQYLHHSSVCFTGTLSVPKEILEEKTREANALSTHQVSTQTNYLVIGSEGFAKVRYGRENKKVKKALHLIRKGQDLKIVHENEFIEMLNIKRYKNGN